MTDKITVRNNATLEIKEFDNPQEIADFLHTETYPGDWVGFEHLGQLPEPTAPETPSENSQPASAEENPSIMQTVKGILGFGS